MLWRQVGLGKDARWRLFVLGADPDSSTFEHSKYMYIGEDFGQRLENKIEFLKRCQLLKNLEGQQCNPDACGELARGETDHRN